MLHLIRYTLKPETLDKFRGVVEADETYISGLENFWTLPKPTIKGTYTFTSVQHLAAYLHEQVYRFNSRLDNDGGRFLETMGFVTGKRLTYETLTHGRLTLYH